jgi:ABC-type multidrug transport system fused ATPase/permease subunit
VMGCDRICVLDRGRIVEQGDHWELMRLGGTYAAMSRQQLHPNPSGLTRAA